MRLNIVIFEKQNKSKVELDNVCQISKRDYSSASEFMHQKIAINATLLYQYNTFRNLKNKYHKLMNMSSIIKHSPRDSRSIFASIIKVISLSLAQYFSSLTLSVYAIQT